MEEGVLPPLKGAKKTPSPLSQLPALSEPGLRPLSHIVVSVLSIS